MVEPPTLGQVYVGETSVDVGSTPTPVSRPQTVGAIERNGTTQSVGRHRE